MSSIHYPTLTSTAPVPVSPQRRESGQLQRKESLAAHSQRKESVSRQPQRKQSNPGQPGRKESLLAPHPDSRRKASTTSAAAGSGDGGPSDRHRDSVISSMNGGESSAAKRKRATFPPILQARSNGVGGDGDVSERINVTSSSHGGGGSSSSRRRGSITEVVSRMRVREKTLMGEDLLRGTHQQQRQQQQQQQQQRSSVAGSRASRADPFVPSITIEVATPAHGQTTSLPDLDNVWRTTGARNSGTRAIPTAWATPRDRDPAAGRTNGFAVGFHLATPQVGMEDRPHEDGSGGVVAGETFSSPTEESAALDDGQNEHQVNGDDDDDDEEEFDFDAGEDEVTSQREQQLRSRATGAVYLRACQALKVQPSPAFLRQCNLTTMDLSDVRLGPVDVKPIAIALVRDTRVSSLDLSNNDLGPIGVSYIAEMLRENNTIYELNLSATKPGREGVKALCETLPHNRSLAYLRLEENGIEHTESHLLADLIRFVPGLQGLFLGHNRLGYSGGAAIASALSQNSSMRALDLQWNHIRRDSAVALVRALETNKHLRSLNLAWNGLGKEGCLALAHALPKNGCLRELDLTCNRVDLMSLGFLLHGVTGNTSLACLKIGQNPLTTDGAKAVISAISSTPEVNIRDIDICGVPVDLEFTKMVSSAQETRVLRVKHEEAVTLATSDRKREHDGNNLDRFDPVMVLFEYMKLDNLRVIDMFQFMDVKKRDKLSKGNIRDGLNTLKIPVTEHAIDVIFEKLDINEDGFVELDEMMKVQRDTARQVKLRQIKAKKKNKEDGGLQGLHQALRDIIAKRKEENEAPSSRRDTTTTNSNNSSNNNTGSGVSTTKTSGGGRKSSVGGLQLTQARYSVTSTSSKRRGEESDAKPSLAAVVDQVQEEEEKGDEGEHQQRTGEAGQTGVVVVTTG